MSNYTLYVNDEIKMKFMSLSKERRETVNNKIREVIEKAVK